MGIILYDATLIRGEWRGIMRNKILRMSLVCSFMIGLGISTIHAAEITVARLTPNTYVTSEHGDEFLADIYIGKAYVRGTDWFYSGGMTCYPTWSKVTYNVQGSISTRQVNSLGKEDATVRSTSITVKDKWNFGSKTQVYGNFGSSKANNATPRSIED